jgi:hypothetical protein
MLRRAFSILIALCACKAVFATDDFSALTKQFPDLGDIVPPSRNPYLGGQNFTYCCLKAVNSFLRDSTSPAVSVVQPFSSQFPCGATFNGDRSGVSSVSASYNWCNQECTGWEKSQSGKLNQWLQPFVGFILPAVIFCLSVPRRKKLSLPPFVFPERIDIITLPWAIFCSITAGFIVAIDTIIWLFVVFAFSGPMLLSGIYEAWLDKKVVDSLDASIKHHGLPLSLRARILFAVLVGNLDIDNAWEPTMALADSIDLPATETLPAPDSGDDPRVRNLSDMKSQLTELAGSIDSTRVAEIKIEEIGGEQRLRSLSDVRSRLNELADSIDPPANDNIVPENRAEEERIKRISDVKSRLKSMLACQYSFGTTIGAPVVFYIGSFVYAIIEINTTLGDNDSAHALGFGMWWMSIPHISIISGCLLAGNNPNTLEGIAPQVHQDVQLPEPGNNLQKVRRAAKQVAQTRYRPVYDAFYKPAWMWDRGKTKQRWLVKLCDSYRDSYANHLLVHDKLEELKGELYLSVGNWITISSLSFLLYFIPCMLGLLEAYWTPQIGLSCRSMTFLTYAAAQSLLSLIWICDFSLRQNRHFIRAFLWFAMAIGLVAAIFSAIGGTLMQIIGVYRNCLCKINISSWRYSKDETNMLLSSNNKVDIDQAELHWKSMGIAAAVFLGVTCYVGWWYQRRLRYNFKGLVERLDTRLPNMNGRE